MFYECIIFNICILAGLGYQYILSSLDEERCIVYILQCSLCKYCSAPVHKFIFICEYVSTAIHVGMPKTGLSGIIIMHYVLCQGNLYISCTTRYFLCTFEY